MDITRHLQRAREIAGKSDLKQHKVAAMVIKNKQITLFAHNYHYIMPIFSIHAEDALITKAARMGYSMKDSTVLVYRRKKVGIGTSKPCESCEHKLRKAGVKTVIYFDGNIWVKEKYT